MDALTPELVAVACGVALLAGLVKGLVGFAMPMILISGLSMMVPPDVALLTALDTEKSEHLRVQGVIYGAGAVVLMGAHLASGVLNAETFKVSALLVPPALLGIWAGFAINDRIDQAAFRRLTLILLLLAGLNLLRRALFAG